jgi:Sec-independent protein secretion pathway component TatC
VLTGALLVSWIASIGFAAAALEGAGTPALLALPLVALVAVGLVCRRFARRRCERIDWLRQRPIRWLTPPSPRIRYGR